MGAEKILYFVLDFILSVDYIWSLEILADVIF